MTGEVTDRFNEITLFGMVYFGKKQLNSLQNCYKINYLTRNFTAYMFHRSLSDRAEYGLLGHRSMLS